ncbi:MAG: triple tyrosine motif-containing protein [Bacteroidota bacterium]
MSFTLAVRALKSLLFFLLTIGPLAAQQGGYFLSHHKPQGTFDEVSFDILQDDTGIMYVANRTGIIIFDGKHWDFLQTPSAIFALTCNKDTKAIYTAGRNGFGKLERNNFFNLKYQPLSDSSFTNSDIFSILESKNKLYGINEQLFFEYDLETGQVISIQAKSGGYFTDLFLLDNRVHVINTVRGILELDKGSLIPTKEENLNGVFVNSFASYSDNKIHILEQEDQSLWLYKDKKLSKIPLGMEDESFLKDNRIQQIVWLDQDVVAASMVRGGLVFLEPSSGKFLQVLDSESGLPDDEIYFISTDSEKNLWISHRKGFTRVSPTIPFRNFSGYTGLDGELSTAIRHDGTLYVGTTSGLYFLETVEQFENEAYYETREVVDKSESREALELVPQLPSEKKRRGLFSFLKKKGRNKGPDKPDTVRDETTLTTRTVTEKKLRKKLHSVLYRYKKVKGINSRVSELVSAENQLLVASVDGFFELNDKVATQLLKDPVNALYYSSFYKTAFLGTANGEIKIVAMANEPVDLHFFDGFSSYTSHIFEDINHKLWFCGTSKMIWITLDGMDLDETGEVNFENPYFYDTYGGVRDNEVVFINASAQYQLYEDGIKQVSKPKKFVKGSGSEVWVLETDGWKLLGSKNEDHKFELLTVFVNPGYLTLENDYVWLINDQSLLRLSRARKEGIASSYDLLLRGVTTDSSNLKASGKLVIDQDKSALKFEFVKPDYSGIMDIQYQYKLAGLADSKWTEWSKDYGTINFPYLPEGDYTLSVRSRDTFGMVSSAETISLKVVPPYWKRPWFYALEFTALGLLLIISLRIKRLGYRYRLGSRLLALLTLIIIIEFIQTIAENEFQTKSSAIFDFAIQVIMAIIILPLEGLLRKYIFKEKNIQLLDFFRLKQKHGPNEK